jgi:hypothetical protein
MHSRHSTTLQCKRLMDHVTLNFNNNMSTAAVFLDTEKTFDKHGTLPCYIRTLSKLKFPISQIKLISFLLS